MAHDNPTQLNMLLRTLDCESCDVFLHIDLKSKLTKDDINPFRVGKIYIFKEISIFWADYTQVECELFLLEKALQNFSYSYYHLLSGADVLLKSPRAICNLLTGDEIYLHFATQENVFETYNYVALYHFFQRQLCIVNRGKKISLFKVINKISLLLQKNIVNRISPKFTIKKGANWFSIPHDVAQYVVSEKAFIKKQFSMTRSPDEFFMQSLLYNSDFRSRLYHFCEDDDYTSCLRLIDWKRGTPYVYRLDDLELIEASDMFFARKFDWNIDSEIIKKLQENLLNEEIMLGSK